MKIFFISLFLLSHYSIALNKTNKESAEKTTALEVLQKYANAKHITVDIEKQDEKLTIGTKTISKGIIKYASEKIYLLLNSDKKTELYFKNGKLTLVDYPDEDFDKNGIRKVTIITKKTPAFLKSLIHLFSNPKTFFNEFKITESNLKNDILTLKLKPNSDDLKKFELTLDTKRKTIESLSFVDDVDTKTSIFFKELNLKSKISKMTFEYKSKSSDQVVAQ